MMRKLYPLILIIFFILSGWVVQYIPSQPTDDHIKSACNLFSKENAYYSVDNRKLDNYTDGVMLLISKSGIIDAGFERFMYSPLKVDLNAGKKLEKIKPYGVLCNEKTADTDAFYSRYWHGYQIILRPLLYFMDYKSIRLINKTLQPILFLLILFLFYKKQAYGLIPAWIFGYILLSPIAMSLNMAYSTIYYIFSLALVLMLLIGEKIEKKHRVVCFFHDDWHMRSFFRFVNISHCFSGSSSNCFNIHLPS